MKESQVRDRAFSMPLTSPAYAPGPYRFRQREYLIIAHRASGEKLRALVPEPLQVHEPIVKYEFIRMPDSTGFGDYTESGKVIPVSFRGEKDGFIHCMFLNDEPPITGGRELWGFQRNSRSPRFAPRSTPWRVPSTIVLSGLRLAPWVTSTRPLIRRRCWPRSPRPSSCSRSSPMSMAARASASWSSTISKTSSSKVLDWAWRASSSCARFGAGRRAAGAGGYLGYAHHRRFDRGLNKVVHDYLR